MIYLLLGQDDYSKYQYISSLAKRAGLEPIWYDASDIPDIEQLTAMDLFSKPSLHVLVNVLSKINSEQLFALGEKSPNTIILNEDKLDKRKKETKTILDDKRITVQEFPMPEGRDLERWVGDEAARLGLVFSKELQQLFLDRVVGPPQTGFGAEIKYSLWQIQNELAKLASYGRGAELTKEALEALIPEQGEAQVWDIVNAIAEKKSGVVSSQMAKFFLQTDGSDEKAKTIQLSSLLAEQLRNIALAQAANNQGIQDSEILSETGWKSGRLFMVRKAAQKFNPKVVQSSLAKLASLDLELKSTTTPPRVLLDLIISQMM